MYHTIVTLKKGEGRTIKAGGMWIYDNEIASILGDFENGDLVTVHDFDGYFMGYGFLNMNSRIRVRMMSRRKDQVIDEAFLERRVRNAWEYRKTVCDTSCCRVIFGEADFLPGLVVDKFSDVLVVESLALGIDRMKLQILDILKRVLAEDGIVIRGIYERSDAKVREQEGMKRQKGFIGDPFDTKVEIQENGVRYLVNVEDGQKTGFFLDQKYNRLAVQRLCKGKKVLDCFTHTGSFALNAAVAGASSVLGVDASELGCELDAPAFTNYRIYIKNAVKGYREIILLGMKLLRDGGYLATCSCSHFMDQELFAKTLREAAHGAHRRLRQVEFRTQACDHPILWAADQSYYLKFYIFQVVEEM